MYSHYFSFLGAAGSLMGVTVGRGEEPLSVTVSWDVEEGADTYTVTFTLLMGEGQEGLCAMSTHMASLVVNAISGAGDRVTASVPVGAAVDSSTTNMLRAFTTYTVVVVAASDAFGDSTPSDTVLYTTQQIGEQDSYSVFLN